MTGAALDLAIRGGTVVTAGGRRQADIGIRDGRIASVGEADGAKQTIDATGLFVLPGAIDVHTHLRLPTGSDPDRFFAFLEERGETPPLLPADVHDICERYLDERSEFDAWAAR